jgi:DNA-binding CsgD family transcriptional regulator
MSALLLAESAINYDAVHYYVNLQWRLENSPEQIKLEVNAGSYRPMINYLQLTSHGRRHKIKTIKFVEKSIEMLFSVSQAKSAAFYHIDENYQTNEFTLYNISSTIHDEYINRFAELDPLNPKLHATNSNRVLSYRKVVENNSDGSTFIEEFLEHHGLGDAVEMFFRKGGAIFAGFSLFRGGQPKFSAEDLDLLRRIHPFYEYTLQNIFLPYRELERTRLAEDYSLTPREIDIVDLIRSGASNKHIVRFLDISLGTVKAHLVHIFEKVKVKNRTELVSVLFLD